MFSRFQSILDFAGVPDDDGDDEVEDHNVEEDNEKYYIVMLQKMRCRLIMLSMIMLRKMTWRSWRRKIKRKIPRPRCVFCASLRN